VTHLELRAVMNTAFNAEAAEAAERKINGFSANSACPVLGVVFHTFCDRVQTR